MKILFLVPYPIHEAPSQRFRFEQYLSVLNEQGHSYSIQSFFTLTEWKGFYLASVLTKTIAVIKGLLRRVGSITEIRKSDYIFIHRETAPIGPPLLEWFIAKILKKKIIYDFDDAIWTTDQRNESSLLRFLKWRKKVGSICRWSYKVSCGNEYLCTYARSFNKNVFFNPTTIDTEKLHNPELFEKHNTENNRIIIGWTGSHSTLKYLSVIEPVLQNLELHYPQVDFWIIADRPPELSLKHLVFKKWSLTTEIVDLTKISIGIMPLPDDQWTQGKCGFKALQYMALGIPTVASSVGVNSKIIDNNKNGFLCQTPKDWENNLKKLIEDKELRTSIGLAGRLAVIQKYSVLSNTQNFLALFS